MKASKRQKRIAYYLSRGCQQAETRSTKYFAFSIPDQTAKLWLGQSAIRKGRTAGESFPVYCGLQKANLDGAANKLWQILTAEEQQSIIDRFPDKKRRPRLSTSTLREQAIDNGRRSYR